MAGQGYRPEIDGIRAIAVVIVMFFHANVPGFGGGFVGVDVFFVISGYLITRMIVPEVEAGSFSIAVFYERRARRLLPALYLVIAASVPFAWWLLVPSAMKDFGESVGATVLFVSNILFLDRSGYFGPAAEEIPLLHTWSLAVEEQFYVFYPLIVLALWRFAPRSRVTWLAIIAGASFVACEIASWFVPKAVFFLAPFRAWELLAGAFVALRELRRGRPRGSVALTLAGLFLIGLSLPLLDDQTRFPSAFALLPVGGTVLLLAFSSGSAARLLCIAPVRWVGLVSYSAYLWHQPILVFARKINLGAISLPVALGCVLLSFALAALSWRYVELPFRRGFHARPDGRNRRAWTYLAKSTAVSGLVFAAGAIAFFSQGLPNRFDPEHQRILAFAAYEPHRVNHGRGDCLTSKRFDSLADIDRCIHDRRSSERLVVVWGDSHAGVLSWGLAKATDAAVLQLATNGCLPIIGEQPEDFGPCSANNAFVLELIEKRRPERVILHANWIRRVPKAPLDLGVRKAVEAIHERSPETEIIVLGSVPQWPGGLPERIVAQRAELNHEIRVPMPPETAALLDHADELLTRASGTVARFVSPIGKTCGETGCAVLVEEGSAPVPVAFDYGHLTLEGAAWLSTVLELAP